MPERPPDARAAVTLSPAQAHLYRLASGDYNPLHVDPSVSAALGLGPRPILHGLCTLAVASRAVVAAGANANANTHAATLGCAGDPGRLRALSGRFVAPAYPGEELEVQLWAGGLTEEGRHLVHFRVVAQPRGVAVVDFGWALIEPPQSEVAPRPRL